jgi:hypothetical protein
MCYKTDNIERFDSLTSHSLSLRLSRLCRGFPSRSILDCAFGSARNDRTYGWNGNGYETRAARE